MILHYLHKVEFRFLLPSMRLRALFHTVIWIGFFSLSLLVILYGIVSMATTKTSVPTNTTIAATTSPKVTTSSSEPLTSTMTPITTTAATKKTTLTSAVTTPTTTTLANSNSSGKCCFVYFFPSNFTLKYLFLNCRNNFYNIFNNDHINNCINYLVFWMCFS